MFGRSRTMKRRTTPRSLVREVDLDVLEEAGVPQGVHVAGEVLDLEEVAGLLAQVREDVVARDAPVADDRRCVTIGSPSACSAAVGGSFTAGSRASAAAAGELARAAVGRPSVHGGRERRPGVAPVVDEAPASPVAAGEGAAAPGAENTPASPLAAIAVRTKRSARSTPARTASKRAVRIGVARARPSSGSAQNRVRS